MERPSLDHAFRFTDADLKENRRGHLSEPQATVLRRDVLQIVAAIGGGVVLVTILAMLSAQPSPGEMSVIALIVFVPIALILGLYFLRTETALRPRVVSQLTGEIGLNEALYRGYGNYRVTMGDQVFLLTRTGYQALRPGSYTFYFVPGLRKIVAVEAFERSSTERPPLPQPTVEQFDDDSRDTLRA